MTTHAPTGLLGLAALGVRLRWRLSTNRLHRRGKSTRRLVLIAASGYTAANILVLGLARYTPDDDAGATVILLMASMALGWVFGPVLIGGVDETVDPTRLALLPLSAAERYVVQLAGAMSGTGPVAASVGLLVGLSLGHIGLGISLVVVPVAALTAVMMMVGSARALAAILAIAQRSRVGRDAAVLLAALAGGTMFTMAQLARDVVTVGGSWLIRVLSWLPWAWPARAINAARIGEELEATIWILASIGAAALAHLLWLRLSNYLLLHGERSAQTRRRSGRALLNGASTEFGAALSRQWIYLRRSPNSRVGFVFGTVFGIAFAMVQIVQQGDGNGAAAAFGILLAMLANLGAATNVLGFDAGSLWLEVLAGGPSRVNMIARQVIALPNLLLPTWLSGLIVGIWTGQWTLVLLVALLAIPVAVNVLSFGMVASVVAPAPLPDWDNPFGNRQGNESRTTRIAAIAISGMVAIVVLSAPIFIATFQVLSSAWLWLMPALGLAYSVAIFMLVAWWAGSFLRGREPLLIERLAPRALN
jgi:ABC-2 type transport system permease protein